MSIFNTNKHIHIWKVKEKEVIDSPFTTLAKLGGKMSGYNDEDLFKTTVVVHYECNCGMEKVEKL